MQRAKCGGVAVLLESSQTQVSFQTPVSKGGVKEKGGAAALECRSTGSWELRLETEACLKSQDARLKLGKGSFSQRL